MRFVIFSPEDLKDYGGIDKTKCWNSYHAKVSFDKENHRNESAAALKDFSCSYRNI